MILLRSLVRSNGTVQSPRVHSSPYHVSCDIFGSVAVKECAVVKFNYKSYSEFLGTEIIFKGDFRLINPSSHHFSTGVIPMAILKSAPKN